MWYKDLFIELEKLNDDEQAIKMSNYMQNKFPFLGIPKPKLNIFMKPYLKESKKYPFDWNFVNLCWNYKYREAQYIGIEYLTLNEKYLNITDLDNIKNLIITKSWWETVDSLDSIVGNIILKNDLYDLMLEWSNSDNLWLRRVSIDFQQRYKEKTNKDILKSTIVTNLGSDEFFINKAIGWSLREYSKTNSKWVLDFINKYQDRMNKLSIKEALKIINGGNNGISKR